MNRLDPQALRQRLQEQGAWSKKRLGQHFLIEEKVLRTIIEVAHPPASGVVVEIGPGPGVLTEVLLEAGATVLAFELDTTMLAMLQDDFAEALQQGRLELIGGDVLKTAPQRLNQLQTSYEVIANIPYQITTPLLELFLQGKGLSILPERLTFLMQREVAERLSAKPQTSARSFLSVLTQYYAVVEYVTTVPPQAFWPAPAVDSAVVTLTRRAERMYADDPEKELRFLKTVRMLFQERRKQLKNVIAGIRGGSVSEVVEQLARLGLPETVRAQELSNEDWQRIFEASI